MVDAEYKSSVIIVTAGNFELRAKGRITQFDGYTRVLPTTGKQENSELPDFKVGTSLELKQLKPYQRFTRPPLRYTEASLVKELEKHGIGRPSTYASIISVISNRGYADIVNKNGWTHLKNVMPNMTLTETLRQQIICIINNNMSIQSQDGTYPLKLDCLSQHILDNEIHTTEFKKPFNSHLNNMIYQDLLHTKLPRVLRMNDKLSMACGIELRVPFLDHRIVEYAFQLPNEYKINSGQGKYLLRQLGEHWIDKSYISKQKVPVVTPQTEWFKHELKSWVIDTITSLSLIHI